VAVRPHDRRAVGDAEEGLKSYPLKRREDDLYVALGR